MDTHPEKNTFINKTKKIEVANQNFYQVLKIFQLYIYAILCELQKINEIHPRSYRGEMIFLMNEEANIII